MNSGTEHEPWCDDDPCTCRSAQSPQFKITLRIEGPDGLDFQTITWTHSARLVPTHLGRDCALLERQFRTWLKTK